MIRAGSGPDVADIVSVAEKHQQPVNTDGAPGAFGESPIKGGIKFGRFGIGVHIVGGTELIGGIKTAALFSTVSQFAEG